MRLPQHLVESPWFVFGSVGDFVRALDPQVSEITVEQIYFLSKKGLPPAVSLEAIATMLGINPGLIWSFANRSHLHYRTFQIPKGRGTRTINAPRVGLKVLQKWLSHHISSAYQPDDHVFGFVPGRSHILAAASHSNAEWAYSIDIRDYFGSTPISLVEDAYHFLGYDLEPARLLSKLSCIGGFLSQGAPTSPPLSNICFRLMDRRLRALAKEYNATLSRYADDIMFSGSGSFPPALRTSIREMFDEGPWKLADEKESLQPLKGRIKVHGLLVGGGNVRLTKGYRNKIRAYQHVLRTKGDAANNKVSLRGHVGYARTVSATVASFAREAREQIEIDGILADLLQSEAMAETEVLEHMSLAQQDSKTPPGTASGSATTDKLSWMARLWRRLFR